MSDDQRKQLAADLLDRLQQLTALDADLEYSILRGKLDADDVRAIHQGLQVAIETLRDRSTAARCADCAGPIGQDAGPQDGWQLEDGRTVCHQCCAADTLRQIVRDKAIDTTSTDAVSFPRRQRGKLTARSGH